MKRHKSKRQLEMDNFVLKIRVQFLENLLCPMEQHSWVKVDYDVCGGTGHGDETFIYHYRCRKCNKTVSTYKILKESEDTE